MIAGEYSKWSTNTFVCARNYLVQAPCSSGPRPTPCTFNVQSRRPVATGVLVTTSSSTLRRSVCVSGLAAGWCPCLATADDVHVDGEVRIDQAHLVLELLGHTLTRVRCNMDVWVSSFFVIGSHSVFGRGFGILEM